jgi:branched-chain amino acid transport system ATP-binding protein
MTKAGPPAMLLEVIGLASHYGRIQALHGIDLAVAEGELLALVGGNGAGKTTLLRAISGVQPVSGGTIRFAGADLTRVPAARRVARWHLAGSRGPSGLRARCRSPTTCCSAATPAPGRARFVARAGLRHVPGARREAARSCRHALGRPAADAGDRPRADGAAAPAVARRPSMGLAPLLVAEIFRAIRALKAGGTTIFLVEQNAHAALSIADRGYVLETGRIVLQDSGPALLANEKVQQAYLGV